VATPVARVPAGPAIRPGEKDVRVAVLRERLGVTGAVTADDGQTYDAALVQAVKSFQKSKGLNPTGIIGPQTVTAVNETAGGVDGKIADIVANMERWRWLPRDLGAEHVLVNVPDFTLVIERNGTVVHKAKVIVGRVQNQTPIFSETMTHIIVNPYWNVPVSIVQKEFLAKAQETQGASLERGNYEVEVGNKLVSPSTVDWSTVNAANVHIRQRPGDGNALGNIKFMFPNQHSVYIHDTSSRGLFQQTYRSLSHGCVRVNEPFSFADALLADEPTGINGAKLKSMIGGGEKYLWLKKPIPVHIAYFTTFVDDDGTLQTRPDLYGHNARVKQLLGL
jgi:L,D-transpeptidase YcbB